MSRTIDRKSEITAYLVKLFVAFPVPDEARKDTSLRTRLYLDALAGLPAWTVGKAVEGFINGSIARQRKTFAPSPPELVDAARDAAARETTTGEVDAKGRTAFGGEVPVTWIEPEDPLWPKVVAVHRRHKPESRPIAYQSKYADELGYFFRTEFVRQAEAA